MIVGKRLTRTRLSTLEDSMKTIRRIARTSFLIVLAAAVLFGGCGKSEAAPPVAQEAVKQTPDQEFAMLLKKAKAGDARAQSNLGLMYYDGLVVPKDTAKALEWFQKAAAQGYAEAQYSLGVMYANGLGVPKNAAKAVEWYQKAAA